MNRIVSKVPDGVKGDWRIETFSVSEADIKLHNLRAAIHGTHDYMEPGTYKRLMRGNTLVMSDTVYELQLHREFIWEAKGEVLINGLGLGVVLQAVLEKPQVKHVTVIELSKEVISLVGGTFAIDPRVTIIWADALTWKAPKGVRYDAVWSDIWDNICADNVDDMAKLNRKYGRRSSWKGCWGEWECKYGRYGRYR